MKHLGMVKCEDRREFAGNSERLSMHVLMGYHFHSAMSLLIQTEGHGLFLLVIKSWKPDLHGFRAAW